MMAVRNKAGRCWSVVLTVADHDQNGFVSLAIWPRLSECEARSFIECTDSRVSPEAEPEIETAPFTFILDLIDDQESIVDNGKYLLPTQIAMSLAPEQVREWLDERPNPDSTLFRPIPIASRAAIAAAGGA